MKYDYIFWDFDGTVMDTYPGVTESIIYALAQFGIREEDEARLRSFIGPPFRVSFPAAYGTDHDTTEAIIGAYRDYYVKGAMYKGDMFPGVAEASVRFRSAGLKQVITTSKPIGMCTDILARKGWDVLFDQVFGATPDGRIDTKIEVLQEAFRVLGNPDRNRVVLIGDTKYDADGAGEAGIDCVGVTYGFGTREDLLSHGARAVFDTIREAADFILETDNL